MPTTACKTRGPRWKEEFGQYLLIEVGKALRKRQNKFASLRPMDFEDAGEVVLTRMIRMITSAYINKAVDNALKSMLKMKKKSPQAMWDKLAFVADPKSKDDIIAVDAILDLDFFITRLSPCLQAFAKTLIENEGDIQKTANALQWLPEKVRMYCYRLRVRRAELEQEARQ